MKKRVKFQKYNCFIVLGEYNNKNLSIQLFDEEGPVATATINLYDLLPKNMAYIKDYSENQGMLSALKNAGIVKDIFGYKEPNWHYPLCLLDLEKIKEYSY